MMLDAVGPLTVGLVFAAIVMACLWLVQSVTRDAGIVDVGWSATLGLLAAFYGQSLPIHSTRKWLVTGMAVVWSFRLAGYLLRDRVIGKPEDGRYRKLRAQFGHRAPWFFFAFFQVQAVLAWIFSLTFWMAMRREGPLDLWDVAAGTIWIAAIVGVSLSDFQLARFRSDSSNRGKTCRRGLWRYSRHPNYFFEWLYWWVYVMIAWPMTWGWITLFAPALMLFFLLKVTGIPATEAQALISRGDDYRDYQRTTSMFVPWFPKG